MNHAGMVPISRSGKPARNVSLLPRIETSITGHCAGVLSVAESRNHAVRTSGVRRLSPPSTIRTYFASNSIYRILGGASGENMIYGRY
jgi:hypothetical protein